MHEFDILWQYQIVNNFWHDQAYLGSNVCLPFRLLLDALGLIRYG